MRFPLILLTLLHPTFADQTLHSHPIPGFNFLEHIPHLEALDLELGAQAAELWEASVAGLPRVGDSLRRSLLNGKDASGLIRAKEWVQTSFGNSSGGLNITEECRRAGSDLVREMEALAAGVGSYVACARNTSANCSWILKEIEGSAWILKALDAQGKVPSGLRGPGNWWAGSWEECWATAVPVNVSFSALKYCTLNINITASLAFLAANNGHTSDAALGGQGMPMSSSGDFGLVMLLSSILRYGACVPNTCTELDLDILLNQHRPVAQWVNYATCKSELGLAVESGDSRAAFGFFLCALFALLLILGTLHDLLAKFHIPTLISYISINDDGLTEEEHVPYLNRYSESLWFKLLASFSIYTNSTKLFNVETKGGEISCIHGIRFLSMAWVIFGHTFAFVTGVVDDLVHLGKDISTFTGQTIGNATVSVDSFFCMSGFLLTYLFMKEMEKDSSKLKKFGFWGMYYLHRYIRLTPPYLLIMTVEIIFARYIGFGPNWPEANGFENDFCRKSWWANALYLNNFLFPDYINITDKGHSVGSCFGHSWYLANDMQFHIVAPGLLLVLFYFGYVGLVQGLGVVALCMGLRGWWTVHYDLPVNQLAGINLQLLLNPNPLKSEEMYFLPWFRIGAYVVGVLGGYLFWRAKGRMGLHWSLVALGWATSLGAMVGVVYGVHSYADGTEQLSVGMRALYNAADRCVWSAALVWLIFACAAGKGGPINAVLSWRVWIPLSRLSYCAYLVHPVVIYYYYASLKEPIHFDSLYGFFYLFLGHLVVSYAIAWLCSMAFEAPVLAIERALRRSKAKKQAPAPESEFIEDDEAVGFDNPNLDKE